MWDKIKQYKKELLIAILFIISTFLLLLLLISQDTTSPTNSKDSFTPVSQTTTYIASKNSDKYHLASCKWAKNIKHSNKITFSSETQATSKGYSPCRTCKP